MFNIIQRVVSEELQLGDDTQLLSYTRSQFVAHLLLVVVDVLNNLLGLLTGEYAQVSAADTEVGTDATGAYTYQNTSHSTGLLLEDVAQLLLDEP